MQMNFNTRELNIIGHWSSSSKMPERYDRSVCPNELLLRNTIMCKFVEGWTTVPSFHLPITVDTSQRIGKPGEEVSEIPPVQVTATTAFVGGTALTQADTLDTIVENEADDDEFPSLSQG